MKIIGLTGGIASGKNFISEILAKNGAIIFDADAEAHKLLESDAATIAEVKNYFPESFVNNKIDRKILGKIAFCDREKLKILEKILHPKIRKIHLEFLKKSKEQGAKLIVLNIPLLLETSGYKCDYIIAVIVKKEVQKKRFLHREKLKDPKNFLAQKKILEQKFEKIKAQQATNVERKKRADFIVDNSVSKTQTIKQVKKILSSINLI